jgi:hypothetical protein
MYSLINLPGRNSESFDFQQNESAGPNDGWARVIKKADWPDINN